MIVMQPITWHISDLKNPTSSINTHTHINTLCLEHWIHFYRTNIGNKYNRILEYLEYSTIEYLE